MSIDNQIVVGMSGHIDHGKTALVKALTGKDTDSLDQEKQRGMTIDIGFAFLDNQITIIDVPGHEKFVKNMMSGCSGIDIAILVIAADDGVMPQTTEHFEILKLLNIKYGFIVLNKIDLVEKEWINLVKKDIEELTKDSFMSNPNIIEASAINNIGTELIKNKIIELSKGVPRKKESGLFRMHIDRTFSKTGFGTIVTGTISSGVLNTGDTVEILPSKNLSKVRNIQTHGKDVNRAIVGERAAINLNNISSTDLSRGYHLSAPNSFNEVSSYIAEISLINSEEQNIKNNQRIRIHLGTKEVMGRISIIKEYTENSINKIMGHIKLENKLVLGLGDRFIIRRYSPVVTIGGGIVFDKCYNKNWKEIKKVALDFIGKNLYNRIYHIINNISALSPLELSTVKSRLNISKENFDEILKNDDRYLVVSYNSFSWVLPNEKIISLKNKIRSILDNFHSKNPMVEGCNKKILFQKAKIDENLLTYLLESLSKEKIIKNNLNYWSLFDFNIGINKEDLQFKDMISDHINKNDFIDIKNYKIFLDNGIDKDIFFGIIKFLESEGAIIKINPDIIISIEKMKSIKESIQFFLKKNSSIGVPEFKEINNLTRKFAIPVLEYLDKINFTYRLGNKRKLSKDKYE